MHVYIQLELVKLGLVNMPRRLVKDESGVTVIEYGLIAAAVALAIAGVVLVLGQDVANLFGTTLEAIGTVAP